MTRPSLAAVADIDGPVDDANEELMAAAPFTGWVERAVEPADEWEAELEPTRAALEVALAEAGYPAADVYIGPTGVHVDDVPAAVVERAQDLVNHTDPRVLPV